MKIISETKEYKKLWKTQGWKENSKKRNPNGKAAFIGRVQRANLKWKDYKTKINYFIK